LLKSSLSTPLGILTLILSNVNSCSFSRSSFLTTLKNVFPSSLSKLFYSPGRIESSANIFLSFKSLSCSLTLILSLTSFPLFLNSSFLALTSSLVRSTAASFSLAFYLSAYSNYLESFWILSKPLNFPLPLLIFPRSLDVVSFKDFNFSSLANCNLSFSNTSFMVS